MLKDIEEVGGSAAPQRTDGRKLPIFSSNESMDSAHLSVPTPALAFDFAKETQKGSGCTGVSAPGTLAPSSLPLTGDSGQLASAPSLYSCLQCVFKANQRRICSMPLKIRLIVSQRSDTVKRKCPELKAIFGYLAHNLSMVLRPSPQPE